MEFSKSHLIFSWFVTLILTALGICFSVLSLPTDMLIAATPLSWAETATATGFYYWKARNENRAKYAQRFIKEIAKEHGMDSALRLAEVVLKE